MHQLRDTAPNDNDDFYNDLLKVIESEPPHNILIVPGHFNTPIDVIGIKPIDKS